ncbi:TRAP transporter TatT component family protein [candidate division KSB1 bacterium]|nr:TRAP transporter TatT component family protein [candidate division KSB1 bacterium]
MKYFFYCLLGLFLFDACSIKKMAINSMADALTEGSSSVFATDDDPILVGDALPFALKTMEGMLQATPEHRELLIATAAGFVQYTHAYVLWLAQKSEYINLDETKKARKRAKKLFIRARSYGLKAMEIKYPDFYVQLFRDPRTAVSRTKKEDVPALYWTGLAWGSAISVAKDDMSLIGDLPIVTALMERAIDLDEDWGNGRLHEFFIIFDAGRSEADGGGIKKAESHFDRAMELNGGYSISPLVSVAETICVRQQDRERFKKLLSQVLEFEIDQKPSQYRLSNILAQQKAEFLLANIDYLFFINENDNELER